MPDPAAHAESRWPHRWVTLLVCAVFPLIWVGGLVTTYDAGMAVPDWPGTYGYNLFLYPWQTWVFGPWDLFIEHGHRLLGATAGLLTIGLVVSVFWTGQSKVLRLLAVIGLVAIVVQGSLGGMRVLLDQRQLALVHGCLGPSFFAFCVCLWVLTSRRWRQAETAAHPSGGRLQRLSAITCLLAFVQLVVGAHMRHIPLQASPETFQLYVLFHVAGALLLLLHVILLVGLVLAQFAGQPLLARPAAVLGGAVLTQILLGVSTWVVKYGWPFRSDRFDWSAGHLIEADGWLQSLIVTGHVAVGSLILATSAALLLGAWGRVAAGSTEGWTASNELWGATR